MSIRNHLDQAANVVSLPPSDRWREGLQFRRDGSPNGNEVNVIHALETAPELAGLVGYDEYADEVKLLRSPPWRGYAGECWTDVDRIELQTWLQAKNLPVNRASVVQDAVVVVARRRTFNPVRDYLEGLKWDHKYRVSTWLLDYLGAKGDAEYLDAIAPRILVGAVARVFEPGCKLDTVPVLEGTQGLGKSRAVQILGQPWNADGVPDLSTKDAAIQIQGVWLVELEELASMSRAEVEHVKAFLSRNIDRYRPPYARNAINRPRRCAFIATTNLQDYLKDETGNRRFWPVRCRDIHHQRLEADRDQLWAEAVQLYRNGFAWHLPDDAEILAAREQQARRLVPEIEAALLDYLDQRLAEGRTVVYMDDLLRDVAGIRDFARERAPAGALAAQFSRALARTGWEKQKPIGRGKKRRQPYKHDGS